MLLALGFIGSLTIFLVIIFLAGQTTNDERRMKSRYAVLRANRMATLSAEQAGDFLKEARESGSSWFERTLGRFVAQRTERLFQQSASLMTLQKLLLLCLGTALSGMVAVFLFLPVIGVAVLAGIVAAYLPIFFLTFKRKRRIAAFNKVLPDAIDMMSRSLRAGHALVAAIGIVAEHAPEPARTEFSEVFRKQNFGLPLRDAMMQLLDRVPSQDLRVLVTGVLVQKDTGGNLAEILDRISFVIRERLKIQGEIRTHTAQGRMTGWILCLLPITMLIFMNFINPGYSKALTSDPFGAKLFYGAFTLLAVGAFLIKRIVDSVEV